jgi:hypothetical protein
MGEVAAETRKIGGLQFEVEEIVPVDRRAVRVVVDGETRIVPKEQVDEFILSEKFKSSDWYTGFSIPSLMGFAKEGLRLRKFERATKVLPAIVGNDEVTSSQLEGFLEEVLKVPTGQTVVQDYLSELSREGGVNEHIITMIMVIGRHDSGWIRANLLKYCFTHRNEIFDKVDLRFQEAIADQDFGRANTYLTLASDLYGFADERVTKIQLIYNKLNLARRALASGEVEQLYPLIPLMQEGPDLRAFLAPILLNAFHEEGKRSLQRGANSRVLHIMSQIPADHRTETTYKLMQEALETLTASPRSILLEDEVWGDLKKTSQSHPDIMGAVIEALLTQINFFLNTNSAHQVNPFLERLIEYRPDPDEENDRIRMKQVMIFKSLGDQKSASEKLSEISVLGVSEYAYLLYSGYYVDLNILLIIGLAPALLAIIYKVLCALSDRWNQDLSLLEDDDDDDEDEEVAPGGFSYISLKRGLSPRMHEYVGLLRKFDLGPEAELKVIKAAYRSAVKEVHPDLQQEMDEPSAARFRKLNERYERILELRKSLGYPEA